MSIGMGMTFVPLTLLATTNVDEGDAGLASGLFNTSQQVGGALGLAILSTLATSRTTHLSHTGVGAASALTRGYHVAFLVGAAMMLAGIVVLWGVLRRRDLEQIDTSEVPVPA
jgi:MFS family permease